MRMLGHSGPEGRPASIASLVAGACGDTFAHDHERALAAARGPRLPNSELRRPSSADRGQRPPQLENLKHAHARCASTGRGNDAPRFFGH